MAYELAQAYVQILPTTKGISGQMTDLLSGDAEKAGANAGGRFSTSFGSALKTLGTATVGALAAGSGALAAFSAASVKTGMEFDSAMSQVAATMGMTMEELENQTGTVELAWGSFTGNLRDYAQEMGKNTAFSASEAADALNYMALAGYDAQTSMEMLPNVLNLAAAGGMELALASDMITDTQSALGLTLEETSAMVDQMAKASSKSNTSVEQLGDAMLKIGATARSVKGGTQELSTVLGVLADNGIKGSEGGTHLRNIMLSLQDAAEDGSVAFGDYLVDIYDTDGNMRSLVDIIGEAKDAVGDLSDEGKNAVLSEIFNKTDLAAVNALLGTEKERYEELSGAIGDAAGAAQDMADTQLDNLEGDVKLFKSALEGTQIALSDQLTPTLRDFVQLGSEGLSNITDALKSGDITGAAEEFGKILSEGISKAVENLPKLVEAGGKILTGLIQGFTENVGSIADGIADTVVSIAEFFGQNVGPFISAALKIATEVATELIKSLPDILVSIGEGIIEGFSAIFEAIPDIIMGVWEAIWDIFGDWDGLSDAYLEETQDIIDRSDEIEESWGKVQEAKNHAIGEANTEADYYTGLVLHLDSLVDANGRVKKGYEDRAKFILGELSEATGVEAELIDGRIKGYDDFKKKIEETIEMQRAESVLAAEKSAYEEAIASQKELAEQASVVASQIEEAQTAYLNTLTSAEGRQMENDLLVLGATEEHAKAKVEAWAKEKAGLTELETEYAELQTALDETYTAIGQYEADYANFHDGNYEALGQDIRDWSATTSEEYDRYRQELEDTILAQEEQVAAAERAVQDGRADEYMVEQAQAALDGSKEALANLELEWETKVNAMTEMAQSTVEPMSTNFLNAGTSALEALSTAFANGTSGVKTSAEKATKEATSAFDSAASTMPKSGMAITDGLGSGIGSGSGKLKTQMENLANDMKGSFNGAMRIESPSGVMRDAGEYMMMGLENGLSNGQSDAESVVTDTASDMIDDVNGYYNDFYSAGSSLMGGLASGMSSRSGEVARIAKQAVKDALDAAKTEGDIKSPSRKMAWVGEMLMSGLAQGIRENTTPVDEITKTVNDVNNAMAEGLDFGTALNTTIDSIGTDTLNRTVGLMAGTDQNTGETVIYITNNIDGASDPEEFASRLCRQIKLEMRMA